MKDRRKNNKIIIFLGCLLFLMSVGYAAFQSNLDIKGTTDISSNWSIRIISADVLNTHGSAENVKNTYTDLTANLEANLYKKGDYVEYKIMVENSGSFDAKLDTLGITNSNNEAVKITNSGFTKGQTLYKNTTAELIIKIEYNSNYSGDASETSGESNITLGFVQAEGGTIVPTTDHLVTYDYTTNGGESTNAENEYIAEGESINLSYTASKTYYQFLGWSQSPTSTTPLESLAMGTEDIVLYALFKAIDTTAPVIDNVSTTSTTNSITVVVTAHDDESNISKYEYSKDGGATWVESTNSTYTFNSLKSGTTYDIVVRATNGVELQTEKVLGGSKTTSDLTLLAVKSGDGLYADSVTSGRYFYRGTTVNNYITFNNETWRIISVEADGSLKIIRNKQISSTQKWDAARARDISTSTYCTNARSYGCNAWAATTNLVGMPSAFTQHYPNGNTTSDSTTYSGTVTQDASLNTYLNGTYYNSLTTTAQKQVVAGTFNVSTPGYQTDTETLEVDAEQEKQYRWQGKIALMTVTELLRASTHSRCTSLSVGYNNGYNSASSSVCKNRNWLWPTFNVGGSEGTVSPSVSSDRYVVWHVSSSGYVGAASADLYFGVRPVVHLSSDITLDGSGTSVDPYTISNAAKTQVLNKPTFSETPTTVTIKYPEGCGSTLTCSYIKDSGSEVAVTTSTVTVTFTDNGTLVAKVSDGTNSVSNSLTKVLDKTAPVIDNVSTTSTTKSITVVVTAHDDESNISKYEYSKDGGATWVESTNSTYTFNSLTSGTTYDIVVRVTNGFGLQTEKVLGGSKTTSDLTLLAVTSGDGLYADSVTEGRYFYRGATVNNYITFNNETWRIISVEADGSLKIIRNEQISSAQSWDPKGARASSNTYCTSASNYGCNAWAATSNLVGTPSVFTQHYPNGNSTSDSTTYSGTVTQDASLNTYLNGTYYDSLTSQAQKQTVTGTFNVSTPGNVNDTETLEVDVQQEKQYQWQGKIALMTVTELLRASTDSGCTSLSAGNNNMSASTCKNSNWLWPTFNTSSLEWTVSPSVTSSRSSVWAVGSSGFVYGNDASHAFGVRPVLHLSSDITLDGSGTSANPYTISNVSTTQVLSKPTFTQSSNVVTIKYPEGCGSTYTCSYIKDSGTETAVTSVSKAITFTADGTLVAKVTDGTNTVSNTYTYRTAASMLKANNVTSGDGLYADSVTSGRYFYRGTTVNNYITFNDETWRILSVESDGTLKIIRNEQLSSTQAWDALGTRDSSTSTYCAYASEYSCNAWAATTNLVGMPSAFTQHYQNGNSTSATETYSGTVTQDASLNTYLNGTYYNSLTTTAKNQMVAGTFNVSTPGNAYDTETLEVDAEQEKQYKWQGKIALMTVTELLRASTSSGCTSLSAGYNSGSSSVCKNSNWLWPTLNANRHEWTVSPDVYSDRGTVWLVDLNGYIGGDLANNALVVRPVVHLNKNVYLTGSGTSTNPYKLS